MAYPPFQTQPQYKLRQEELKIIHNSPHLVKRIEEYFALKEWGTEREEHKIIRKLICENSHLYATKLPMHFNFTDIFSSFAGYSLGKMFANYLGFDEQENPWQSDLFKAVFIILTSSATSWWHTRKSELTKLELIDFKDNIYKSIDSKLSSVINHQKISAEPYQSFLNELKQNLYVISVIVFLEMEKDVLTPLVNKAQEKSLELVVNSLIIYTCSMASLEAGLIGFFKMLLLTRRELKTVEVDRDFIKISLHAIFNMIIKKYDKNSHSIFVKNILDENDGLCIGFLKVFSNGNTTAQEGFIKNRVFAKNKKAAAEKEHGRGQAAPVTPNVFRKERELEETNFTSHFNEEKLLYSSPVSRPSSPVANGLVEMLSLDSSGHESPIFEPSIEPVFKMTSHSIETTYQHMIGRISRDQYFRIWLVNYKESLKLIENANECSESDFIKKYNDFVCLLIIERRKIAGNIIHNYKVTKEDRASIQSHYVLINQEIKEAQKKANPDSKNNLGQLYPCYFPCRSDWTFIDELAFYLFEEFGMSLYFVGTQVYWPHLADDIDLIGLVNSVEKVDERIALDKFKIIINEIEKYIGKYSFTTFTVEENLVFQYKIVLHNGLAIDLQLYSEAKLTNIYDALNNRYLNIASVASHVITKLTAIHPEDAESILNGNVELKTKADEAQLSHRDLRFLAKVIAKAEKNKWKFGTEIAVYLDRDDVKLRLIPIYVELLNTAGSLERALLFLSQLIHFIKLTNPGCKIESSDVHEKFLNRFTPFAKIIDTQSANGASILIALLMKYNTAEQAKIFLTRFDWRPIRLKIDDIINVVDLVESRRAQETIGYQNIGRFQVGNISAIHQSLRD